MSILDRYANRESAADFEARMLIAKPMVDATVQQINDRAIAYMNIHACREALKAFHPIASPDLMRELTEAVDRYEDRVREANGMEPRK